MKIEFDLRVSFTLKIDLKKIAAMAKTAIGAVIEKIIGIYMKDPSLLEMEI